jgi:hypothetical protein
MYHPGYVEAKQIIERARAEFSYLPYLESVELAPGLDRTLQDILQNIPEEPETPEER